jgi:hypothetical protein
MVVSFQGSIRASDCTKGRDNSLLVVLFLKKNRASQNSSGINGGLLLSRL